MELIVILLISLAEIVLFIMILRFFARLRSSEEMLTQLRDGQDELMEKLRANVQFEKDLIDSFSARQQELINLTRLMEDRISVIRKLLDEAETVSRSPQFLREIIINGARQGRRPEQLARATGLSLDEVELIIAQTQ